MIRILCVLVMLTAFPVQAADFITWKDEYGNVHYTDSPENVPSAYRGAAQNGSWSSLYERTDPKLTLSDRYKPSFRRGIVLDSAQKETVVCGYPLTKDLVWVTRGEYTRRMVHTFDSCGQLVEEDFAGSRR